MLATWHRGERDLCHVQDGDTGGQPVIQLAHNLRRLERRSLAPQFQVSHLADGVHPGVCASRALQFHIRSEKILSGLLQLALHRAGVDLLLPAGEARAIVFKDQAERLHFPARA
jgi:hypothetical protein